MSASTIAQIAASVSNIALVVAIGIGYFLTIRVSRDMVNEMYEQRITGGRPQVIVDDIFDRLPEVDISVRNISEGPAKEIRFEFSAPVESSDGAILSDFSHFRDGIGFLSPGKEITIYWDELDNLLSLMRQRGLERGIQVTTHYKDLANNSYSTTWDLNPCIYRDDRYIVRRGMGEAASHLQEISEKMGSTESPRDLSYDSHRVQGEKAYETEQQGQEDGQSPGSAHHQDR